MINTDQSAIYDDVQQRIQQRINVIDCKGRCCINCCTADNWNREDFPYRRLDHGKWELTIPPNADGSCRIPHNSTLKVPLRCEHS